MKPLRSSRAGRIGRAAAVLGGIMSLTLISAAPSQAAVTQLWSGISSEFVTDYSTGHPIKMVRIKYDAFVTTDSAKDEIARGGKLTFTCYGSSGYAEARKFLFTTEHTGTSFAPLTPYGDGMYVNAWIERPRGTAFDVNKNGIDYVSCEATYRQAVYPYKTLFSRTGTTSGYF